MVALNDFLENKLDLKQMSFFNGGMGDTLRTCMDSTCDCGIEDTFYEVSTDAGLYIHSFTRMKDTECLPET